MCQWHSHCFHTLQINQQISPSFLSQWVSLISDSESILADAEEIDISLPQDAIRAQDVLFVTERNIPKKQEAIPQEQEREETRETLEVSISSKNTEVSDSSSSRENSRSIQEDTDTCTPIIWPLWIQRDNNIDELEILENLLISEGFDVRRDGVYGLDDFEAVKDFQVRYREDILDPWGIRLPTGYVYTTTIKKINELLCE